MGMSEYLRVLVLAARTGFSQRRRCHERRGRDRHQTESLQPDTDILSMNVGGIVARLGS